MSTTARVSVRWNLAGLGLLLLCGTGVYAAQTGPAPDAASSAAAAVPMTTHKPAAAPAANDSAAAPAKSALPRVVVHKTAACGCCHLWVEHLQQSGFPVEVHDTDDLSAVKARLGVPVGKGSCHTAEVEGYLVEGHVPASDIQRLLLQRPHARGLVLPGMPLGSPGMEVPDGRVTPYTVELVGEDGSVSAFSQHGSR